MKENYIQNQFATYEISLKLKELGFDEKCIGYFNNKELNYGFSGKAGYTYKVFTWKAKKEVILAPLWQQVIDWFREEHNILTDIETVDGFGEPKFAFSIYKKNNIILLETFSGNYIDDYNLCREQAILKTIKLIQNKQIE